MFGDSIWRGKKWTRQVNMHFIFPLIVCIWLGPQVFPRTGASISWKVTWHFRWMRCVSFFITLMWGFPVWWPVRHVWTAPCLLFHFKTIYSSDGQHTSAHPVAVCGWQTSKESTDDNWELKLILQSISKEMSHNEIIWKFASIVSEKTKKKNKT